LRLRLPVPETLSSYVHIGDTASIHVQALGETFPGKVTRSTGELDLSTRTMQVEIDVPNGNGKLSPGMVADISLNIRRAGNALVVPIQAVDQSSAQPFVMLVNSSNKVEKRAVTIGVATANRVEITSGLTDGDKVIVANLATFQPGETVAPQASSMVGHTSAEAK
ncbi:MAG: efflux RND transporter periplasmic adaptor subunit, partial [Bryocella sp.]